MFGQATYLVWLGVFMGLPILAIAWMGRWALWQARRALGWVTAGALVGGWAWDALSVHWRVWFYNPANISGVWFLGLPLEEWIWIVGIAWLFGGLTVLLVEREKAKETR